MDLETRIAYLTGPDSYSSMLDDGDSLLVNCNHLVANSKARKLEEINNGNYCLPAFDGGYIYLVRITFGHVVLEKYDVNVVGPNRYAVSCSRHVLNENEAELIKSIRESKIKTQKKVKVLEKR